MLTKILVVFFTVIFGGLIWAWRGWDKPKLPSHIRSFIAAGLMVSTFSLFSRFTLVEGIQAILVLTFVESVLGYGAITQEINKYYQTEKKYFTLKGDLRKIMTTNWNINYGGKLCKELWMCLGLISMAYCILPALCLNLKHLLVIGLLGMILFPIAKMVDLVLSKKEISLDTWKVTEGMIGIGIILSWMIGGH